MALFSLGLRPLYLCGALVAVVALAAWTASLGGLAPVERYAQGAHVHAHDLVFGALGPFVAGFLLTAVANWTNRPTLTGLGLAGLTAVWLAARIAAVSSANDLEGVLDGLFWLALVIAIGRPIVATRSRRNYPILLVVITFGSLDILHHVLAAGLVPDASPGRASLAAVSLLVLLCTIIAGRIVPLFLDRARGEPLSWRHPGIEILALGGSAILAMVDMARIFVVVPFAASVAVVAALGAVGHAVRLLGWRPVRAGGEPLLWSLALGYAWLPIGFALRAGAEMQILAPGAAIHALTIGALGGMVFAVATRSSLGHTGRALEASRLDALIYVAAAAAAAMRVGASLPLPAAQHLLVCAGVALCCAFAVFAARYGFILSRPRADAR